MVEAEMLKNVVWHSVATAFASIVLPVPGGPYLRNQWPLRAAPGPACVGARLGVHGRAGVCVCARGACAWVGVRVCVRACVRVCVRARVCV